ncbi:MAG: NusG domain II-containing protein [Actinomycetota bacterium]
MIGNLGRSRRWASSLRRWWGPGDVLLVLVVGLLSVFLVLHGVSRAGGSGLRIRVLADGKKVMELDLPQEKRSLEVDGYQGKSRLEIEGGRVRMVDSACPDKLCVRTGWISRPGESIVCLPNRVVVEVVSAEGGPDVVNR